MALSNSLPATVMAGVNPGACLSLETNELVRCAFGASACNAASEAFLSAFQLSDDQREHCAGRGKPLAALGRCSVSDDEFFCTGGSGGDVGGDHTTGTDACPADLLFEPHSAVCAGLWDRAYFGFCQIAMDDGNDKNHDDGVGSSVCLWSKEGCDENNGVWYPVGKNLADSCNSCEDVLVGGCERDGQVHCAVSAEACDDESWFIPWNEIRDGNNMECTLCKVDAAKAKTRRLEDSRTGLVTATGILGDNRQTAVDVIIGGTMFSCILCSCDGNNRRTMTCGCVVDK